MSCEIKTELSSEKINWSLCLSSFFLWNIVSNFFQIIKWLNAYKNNYNICWLWLRMRMSWTCCEVKSREFWYSISDVSSLSVMAMPPNKDGSVNSGRSMLEKLITPVNADMKNTGSHLWCGVDNCLCVALFVEVRVWKIKNNFCARGEYPYFGEMFRKLYHKDLKSPNLPATVMSWA